MKPLSPASMLAAATFAALTAVASAGEPKFALTKGSGVYVAEGADAEPKLIFDYKDEFALPRFLGFSPDGKSAVMVALGKEARALVKKDPDALEELIDGKELHYQSADGKRERIPANSYYICAEALFSPDGKRIALRYDADLIELWSPGAKSAEKIEPQVMPPTAMEVLAWSADSQSLWFFQAREPDVIRGDPWKGWISRYDVNERRSARYADAPAEAPCLWSLILTSAGPLALAADDYGKAGRIAFAEPKEGKAPRIKLLAEPAAQELLPFPGGKAVAIHWDEAKAWLYDGATKKAEPLAKFDLKGMQKTLLGQPAYALDIGGAPMVAFSAVTAEGTQIANLLLDLKTGEWREIFKGFDLDGVWTGK